MSNPSPQPAPVSPDLAAHRLGALRAELDRVDDALHDSLMRRAELVAQVSALRAKGPVPLRPGREAAIIRRLLARNRGALDPALLVRMWREMISGFTVQQQKIVVAVEDAALLDIAAAHFGLLTELRVVDDAWASLRLVETGEAPVALLRWPGDWWTALLDWRATTARVVARLPFWGDANGLGAMVLTAAEPDPSGDDRTLIGGAMPGNVLRAALAGVADARIVAEAAGSSLAEVKGFIAEDNARLPDAALVLGAYATPIGVVG